MPPIKHALLSTSSSERWLNCPPSARLCERFPDTVSPYAEEGTIAHALCEVKLHKLLGDEVSEDLEFEFTPEMDEYSDQYRDFIEEELNAARARDKGAKLLIEQKLDFSDYVPEGFGTSDAVIVSDDVLEVIDFKYGVGVPVKAEGNPQLRLYALGAYLALGDLYDFSTIKTTVFQPRINNIGGEEISASDLLEWAYTYVRPRAQLAYEGKGEYCVGEHCRFCKAAGVCRAQAEEAFAVVDKADTKPATLTDEEIPIILDKLDTAEKWITAMRKYAEDRAIKGTKWPGYKLVESRTMRKISDPIKAIEALEKEGFIQEDLVNTKLKGIGELEKLMGGAAKLKKVIGEYIVKPKGDPILVKESDARPEINPIEEVFKEE